MYLQITLAIGIFILAGITAHIFYRKFYKEQVDTWESYQTKISDWEKRGYDVSNLKKLFYKTPKPIDWEKVIWIFIKYWSCRLWRFIKYRVIKRLVYFIYHKVIKKSGRILILVTVLSNLAITLSAVGLLVTEEVSFTIGICIAVVGFGFIIWSITRLSKRRKPALIDVVAILVISVIFIMVSSYYLDIHSFSDVKNAITGPFTAEDNGNTNGNTNGTTNTTPTSSPQYCSGAFAICWDGTCEYTADACDGHGGVQTWLK
jgi:hypothetical protein